MRCRRWSAAVLNLWLHRRHGLARARRTPGGGTPTRSGRRCARADRRVADVRACPPAEPCRYPDAAHSEERSSSELLSHFQTSLSDGSKNPLLLFQPAPRDLPRHSLPESNSTPKRLRSRPLSSFFHFQTSLSAVKNHLLLFQPAPSDPPRHSFPHARRANTRLARARRLAEAHRRGLVRGVADVRACPPAEPCRYPDAAHSQDRCATTHLAQPCSFLHIRLPIALWISSAPTPAPEAHAFSASGY